jgi:hypothetical protein
MLRFAVTSLLRQPTLAASAQLQQLRHLNVHEYQV